MKIILLGLGVNLEFKKIGLTNQRLVGIIMKRLKNMNHKRITPPVLEESLVFRKIELINQQSVGIIMQRLKNTNRRKVLYFFESLKILFIFLSFQRLLCWFWWQIWCAER